MKFFKNSFFYFFIFLVTCFLLLIYTKFPTSRGEIYFNRLQKWYSYARVNDWANANSLEKTLDPADIIFYKAANHPDFLKKNINQLILKTGKTADDWVELSRIQTIIGRPVEAAASISKAFELDPIRQDVSKLYYQTQK